MLAKLLRNECDVLNAPISSQLPAIEKNPDIVMQTTPAMNVAFIAVNTQHPALNDNRVRKALNFAINRQNILILSITVPEGSLLPSCPHLLGLSARYDADSLRS